MKYLLNLILFCCATTFAVAQTLPALRSTNWQDAGLRDTAKHTNFILFTGVGDGTTDHAPALQAILNNISSPTIVQFSAGNFFFADEILLPSNVIIRGKGVGITTFTFDFNGANKDCFQIQGSETGNFALATSAAKGDQILFVNNANVVAGDYIRMVQDDQHLLNDSWAYNRTGQVVQVVAASATQITLASPLRMDFPDTLNPYFKKVNAITNTGLECFSLVRIDQVTDEALRNKSSNIKFNRAVNCWVKGVESFMCNYAHFEAQYSANLLVANCYFRDAFEHGSGGRAYGAMLHYATSECRVENSIFKRLRHSMILQIGANGNVFAYNLSTDVFKTIFSIEFPSEDLVCHGNYPYLNLFESNVCEYPKVDASHGINGPYNTFFRNRSTESAFSVSGGNNNQNFLGNEGSKSFSGSGHQETVNKWQGTSGTLEISLAYSVQPDFLTVAEFGALGYPNFNTNASNPAATRNAQSNYIDVVCGTHRWNGTHWENSFAPNNQSKFFDLKIANGDVCSINTDVHVHAATIAPSGRLQVDATKNFAIEDTLVLQAATGAYAQFLANAAVPARYEMVIQNEGWHYISAPLTGVDFKQLENAFRVNYQGSPYGPSAYYWTPTAAEYMPVANGNAAFSGGAFNLFVSEILVPAGGGINGDGNLPVKISLKGQTNNGLQQNSPLGYGTATDFTGAPDGWNLLFNPFPSAINLDQVFANLPAGFEKGAHIYNPVSQSFEVRAESALALGTPTTIAPGQSFFVRLSSSANTASTFYNLTNSHRTVSASPSWLKTEFPFVKVQIQSAENTETIHLYFDTKGTEVYAANTDIAKLKTEQEKLTLALLKPAEQTAEKLVVAALPNQENWRIKLYVQTQETGSVSFEIPQKTANTDVFLIDQKTDKIYNLQTKQNLWLQEGEWPNRFLLISHKVDAENPEAPVVYSTKNGLYVHANGTDSDQFAQLTLYNSVGQIVFESEPFLANQSINFLDFGNQPAGVYVVEIVFGGKQFVQKVVR